MTNNIGKEIYKAFSACASLVSLSENQKNELLSLIADGISGNASAIIKANELDLKNAASKGEAFCDRLLFNEKRIADSVNSIKKLITLPDPIGKVLESRTLYNGLKLKKISVPLGVVAIIYEARPNVTVDASCIALKTSNAVVLRGGSEAKNTNKAITEVIRSVLKRFDACDAVTYIECDHESVTKILTDENVDLAIPRGSKKLIDFVRKNATVPVIETGAGNCSAYIDCTCDIETAKKVVLNAKTQRISVCNALESLYIDKSAVSYSLPVLIELLKAGVVIHADDCVFNALSQELKGDDKIKKVVKATEADYYKEYLAMEISAKTVCGVSQAVKEINKYGTHHSDVILSQDKSAIEYFFKNVDSAAVYSNASTRFTDGGEFGLGCEIGISTQKTHARGPMGLNELTTYKYIVEGEGQIRE